MATKTKKAKINPIREYWEEINSGRIRVSKKIKKVVRKLVQDLDRPQSAEWRWRYSEKKANRALDFVEGYCRQSKGKMGGQPLKLELWERAYIAALFGFVDYDGNRKYTEAWLIVARKNGKSTLAAAIGLYCMIFDNEAGAEVYAVATKKDQAKIIWNEAKRMVQKSPVLRKYIRRVVSEMTANINDSTFKPLGADSETLDGLNVHCGLLDEVHAWKGLEMYQVVVDGTSSRDQPLILGLTTAGTVRDGIYDVKYDQITRNINSIDDNGHAEDESLLAFVYELDKREEWTDPECWIKANPGLGTIKKIENLQAKVVEAQKNHILIRNLLCKDFNVPTTEASAFLEWEDIKNDTTFDVLKMDPRPRYGIGGYDLSRTTDLTAAVMLFQHKNDNNFYVLPMFWLPEELLEQRAKEDKIPYDKWHEMGLLRTCPGHEIDPDLVVEWFNEVQRDLDIYVFKIGYDRYGAKHATKLCEDYFGPDVAVPVAQGKKTLSLPMQSLGAAFKGHKIIYNANPILAWNAANVAVDMDKNGNIQPCKGTNQRKRIDGFAALLNAYTIYLENIDEYSSLI